MPETVRPVKIEDEMRSSYLDYAMSVIVARALPDVRDGLKPVHRRILYAMNEMGLRPNTPYKKSARIVGEVLGKYHPHGDTAVYDTMVRMAQDFSMRYPLIDGQGNFGSVDNDPPAAMRYTEARLAPVSEEMLVDIDKNTVDFANNFDDSMKEPSVLPARLPNLLLNGTAGIAVGMATSIPPHNLGEVCDGISRLIDDPDATSEDLAAVIKGPDFPTGGIILGREGIHSSYATGHGRIVVRAKAHIEEMSRGGRFQIVVTELPYQVNKAALVEKIADLVKDKRLEAISELRDESDRHGMRIVMELRKDANPRLVLNTLFKHTPMQIAFTTNMLALVNGQPRVLHLKAMLQNYILHRREVTTRRAQYDLEKARERAHILEGLKIALDHLDAIIKLIRESQTVEVARDGLIKTYKLSEAQAHAILEMQLRRLAALERKKIVDEYAELLKTIAELEDLLANPKKIDFLIKSELQELKTKYGDERRTRISEEESGEITEEDLLPDQEVAVTISRRGYIKRVPADTYRVQRRGGKGITGMVTREADAVQHLLVANTRDSLLLFTNLGKVYSLRCHEVPDASRLARGIPLVNLISLEQKERVTAVVAVPTFEDSDFMVMVTKLGEVKKTALSNFAWVRSSGIIAMDLEPDDELVGAERAHQGSDIIVVTAQGQSIRFREIGLRDASRTSGGVKAIRLGPKDRVVAMDVVETGGLLLVVSASGFGKRTPLREYPMQGRGGGGVRTLKVLPKTGEVVAAQVVYPGQELILISAEGIVLRTSVDNISIQGRSTQGVSVMRLDNGDSVVSMALINNLAGSQLNMLGSGSDSEVADKAKSARPVPKATKRGKSGVQSSRKRPTASKKPNK